MFSRLKRQLPTFLPLGAGLLIIGLVTVLGGLWNYQNELDGHLVAASLQPVVVPAAQKDTARNKDKVSKTGSEKDDHHSAGGMSVAGGAADSPVAPAGQVLSAEPEATARARSSATKDVRIVSVSLSVNGQAQGRVDVADGSTQCDVLSQALSQGVIRSLDMRYNSQWGTRGVYVINGVGDPSVVWWTYTVNGSSPPYGCGYLKAHSGDSVNWQYIKR